MNNQSNSSIVSPTDTTPGTENYIDAPDIVLKVCYSFFGTLGIVGNLLVCVVFIKLKRLRKTLTNVFILNQSLIDLTIATIFIVLMFVPKVYVMRDNIGGDIVCAIWVSEYILWGLFISSTYNLTALSIERYLAICHPVYHRNKVTIGKVKIVVVAVWVLGYIRECYWPTLYHNINGVCHVKDWPTKTVRAVVGWVVFLTEYVLPLGIMTFSYGKIIVALRKRSKKKGQGGPQPASVCPAPASSRNDDAQGDPRHAAPSVGQAQPGARTNDAGKKEDDTISRARKNVTKTMLIVSVTFAVCWSPTSIIFFADNQEIVDIHYDGPLYYFTVIMVFCNMCVNPFIYALKYKDFRAGVREIFRCGRSRVGAADQFESVQTQSTALRENPSRT
ncbi:cholecystokinin receptor type A-like [Ptychodera flava]|uniref:cholecystokinin receptor type A-like n=1 Tax=Ptychodera flava TaxID=63121 RepID=UPI003969EF3D